ncbi:MAG TPA: hypothetical protein VK432_09785 [Stellaceae bacterium]|nr:hypothetical protein [Stellaceae bacterium]
MAKRLTKAAFLATVLGLTATAVVTSPASAQYWCPDGYYYIEGYGCAPLGYYSDPIIVPGFGFYYGRGWRGGGWHGGYHGGAGHAGGHHR